MFKVKFVVVVVLGLLLATSCGGTDSELEQATNDRCSKVGVFLIAEAPAIQETVAGAKAGLFEESGLAEADIEFTEQNAQGDPGAVQTIARFMADSDNNLFIVLGTSATIALQEVESERPIVTLGMADPIGSNVVESLDRPGGNVTGSTDYVDPASQLAELLKVEPAARAIGTVYDPSQPNAEKWVRDFEIATEAKGVEFVSAAASTSGDIGIAARSLVDRVDAIMIGNDANTLAGIDAIAATAEQGQIPLYLNGGDHNVPGVFATLGPDFFEVGRLAGINAGKICNGEKPADLPFGLPGDVTWAINTDTMNVLDLSVPQGALD